MVFANLSENHLMQMVIGFPPFPHSENPLIPVVL